MCPIVMQLQRIADALEVISSTYEKPKPVPPEYAKILANVSPRLGDKREPFAKLVYDNASKPPKEISKLLKAAGLLSSTTYWRDVRILRLMEIERLESL